MKSIKYTIAIGISLIFLQNCTEKSTSVGISLIPNADTLVTMSFQTNAMWDTSIWYPVGGGGSRLLLGKWESIESKSMIEFSNLPKLPEGSKIESAYVCFYINYFFKNTCGALSFSAYKVLVSWDARNFTIDSLLPNTYDSNPVGSFSKTIIESDTSIYLYLDTMHVRSWCDNGKFSLILIPESGIELVVGFPRPELNIVYSDSLDSLYTIRRASSQHLHLASTTLPSTDGLFYIQAGTAYRGVLKFDNDKLKNLAKNKACVTRAILELSVDTARSLRNSYSRDSLIAWFSYDTDFPLDSLSLPVICEPVQPYKYRAEINSYVQRWLKSLPYFSIVLSAAGESTTLDRFALYGWNAQDAEMQPKLVIIHTNLP